MAAVAGGGGQRPVRVIGWPPRTCHERVAVAEDGNGPAGRGLVAGAGCRGLGRAAGRHHRHSVRHTAFSVDARTEQRGAGQ